MNITTDFIIHCLRRAEHLRLSALIPGAALIFTLAFSAPAAAEGIVVRNARFELADETWQVSADFDIQFTPTLQEAVNRGVPLYFIIEFEVRQPRWYWRDKKNVFAVRERRIAYAPLTQQYRLSVGNFSQNISGFDELKRQLSSLRGWEVTAKDTLKPGEQYEASLRMRLDTSQLPRPFQVSVVASRDWSLSSEWHRWSVTP